LNLVLSYGDLSKSGGYRTRVVGELEALDSQTGLDPFLLVFEHDPAQFEKELDINVPHQVFRRIALPQFYRTLAQIRRRKPIQLVHAHNLYSGALALSCRRAYGYKAILG